MKSKRRVRREQDWERTSPTHAIVEAISELEQTAPLELDFTLYEFVDPEALHQLISNQNTNDITFEFTVDQYQVEIDGSVLSVELAG